MGIVGLKYYAQFSSVYSTDDRSGGVTPGIDITGAEWGSYLWNSAKFNNLPVVSREHIEASLPFRRTGSVEPNFSNGSWGANSKNYYSGGASLERKVFTAY